MPEPKILSVVWTERALQHAISIRKYLQEHFSSKEVDHFVALLRAFEFTVRPHPKLYPETVFQKAVRRAVLNKVCSVFYRIYNHKIEILAILGNRCDLDKWL
ncbi:MAG: type II toxin-antitoxin system RelE/ParE family toxin [Bacteroidales bacterium]|nr:type II toxin-antitoxin system RelE/ParE family toxin [Bacteroidales bacterium]